MSIDRNRPLQTRDGYAVEIDHWDVEDGFGGNTIFGRVKYTGGWIPAMWFSDGRYALDYDSPSDLVNVPEPKKTGWSHELWTVVFASGGTLTYDSRDDAASVYRTTEGIALVKRPGVEWEEGQYDD